MFKAINKSIKSQIITVTSLCLVVLLMGVFFSAQAYSAAVEAIDSVKPVEEVSSWNVAINANSYQETEGSTTSTSKILSNTIINDVTLVNPYEFIEYTFTVENTGSMAAVLKGINVEGTNENLVTTIKVNNEDYTNTEITLEPESSTTITVRVGYSDTAYAYNQILKLVTTLDITQK